MSKLALISAILSPCLVVSPLPLLYYRFPSHTVFPSQPGILPRIRSNAPIQQRDTPFNRCNQVLCNGSPPLLDPLGPSSPPCTRCEGELPHYGISLSPESHDPPDSGLLSSSCAQPHNPTTATACQETDCSAWGPHHCGPFASSKAT
jgi:hypothetical protein